MGTGLFRAKIEGLEMGRVGVQSMELSSLRVLA